MGTFFDAYHNCRQLILGLTRDASTCCVSICIINLETVCISYTILRFCDFNAQSQDCHAVLGLRNCDRLWINHPPTAKCKFWVRPKTTARSVRGRNPVNAIGLIYGVLATLCRSTKRRLYIVSPGAMLLLPFTDKECGDTNGPR